MIVFTRLEDGYDITQPGIDITGDPIDFLLGELWDCGEDGYLVCILSQDEYRGGAVGPYSTLEQAATTAREVLAKRGIV